MKKITAKWLTEMNACCSEEEKEEAEKIGDIFQIINILKEKNRLRDVHWLLTNYFNKRQRIKYAIFASEQFIDNFENRYPEDKGLREAIKIAKAYLKNPCKETENAASIVCCIYVYIVYASSHVNNADNVIEKIMKKIINYGIELLNKQENKK